MLCLTINGQLGFHLPYCIDSDIRFLASPIQTISILLHVLSVVVDMSIISFNPEWFDSKLQLIPVTARILGGTAGGTYANIVFLSENAIA